MCGAALRGGGGACVCTTCGRAWPIAGGVVRLGAAPKYWGEIPQPEATQMVEEARASSWEAAAAAHFPGRDMTISIRDFQRASWLPLLGLGPGAIALDVGSGYGCITHALARCLREVYSLEGVSERINFTQIRLAQAGITNVHLVQASATDMPFLAETFDLVVINGILEWVGEWDLSTNPRAAQVRFLRKVRQLLRPNGVAVIGIENRFGYGLFLGGMDHSGIAYTSLLPRPLASLLLRASARPHHRTQLNPRRSYRTYTYSRAGYRRLLRRSGLQERGCYWADPGYNQPYHLTPVRGFSNIRQAVAAGLVHPGGRPAGLKRKLKAWASALPGASLFVPEFLIVAAPEPSPYRLGALLASAFAGATGTYPEDWNNAALSLETSPFSAKSVMRVRAPRAARERIVIKAGIPQGRADETSALAAVGAELRRQRESAVRVPELLASFSVGAITYRAETAACGVRLADLVWQPRYWEDDARVRRDWENVFSSGIRLCKVLRSIAIGPSTGYPRGAGEAPRGATTEDSWIQHGDWTVENVFLGSDGVVEVIDWESVGPGYPPLFDLFTILQSTGYLSAQRRKSGFRDAEEYGTASFTDLFLSPGDFPRVAAEGIERACASLDVATECIPDLLAAFLDERARRFQERGSAEAARLTLRLSAVLRQSPGQPILGRAWTSRTRP
ncbi:MAG: methyltransferase domain-containing protein [Terriglobales bacterium]